MEACYFMIGLSLVVIACSLAEGSRAWRAARWSRLITSLAGAALVLAGVAWVTNFAPSWISALAALGGLALLALTELADMSARRGGASLLAGSVMLLAGLFVPVIIGLGVPTFGFTSGLVSNARWLVIPVALLLGAGWYYRWPNWALAVLAVLPVVLAIHGIPGHGVVGPYVLLVACGLLLGTVALNTGKRARATPSAAGENKAGPLVSSGQQ